MRKDIASIYLQQVFKTGKILQVFFPGDCEAEVFCAWVQKNLPKVQVYQHSQGEATFLSVDFMSLELLERRVMKEGWEYTDL